MLLRKAPARYQARSWAIAERSLGLAGLPRALNSSGSSVARRSSVEGTSIAETTCEILIFRPCAMSAAIRPAIIWLRYTGP